MPEQKRLDRELMDRQRERFERAEREKEEIKKRINELLKERRQAS